MRSATTNVAARVGKSCGDRQARRRGIPGCTRDAARDAFKNLSSVFCAKAVAAVSFSNDATANSVRTESWSRHDIRASPRACQ